MPLRIFQAAAHDPGQTRLPRILPCRASGDCRPPRGGTDGRDRRCHVRPTAGSRRPRLDATQIGASPQPDEALEQVPGPSLFRRNSSLSANPSAQGVSLRSIAPSASGRALVTLDGVLQNDPLGVG